MARAAHPDAMKPHQPGRTRTAPPDDAGPVPHVRPLPDLHALRLHRHPLPADGLRGAARRLGARKRSVRLGRCIQSQLANPLYVAFHVLCLAALAFVGVRFFRLFPKAQPAKIGPAKPPPAPVFFVGLYGAWIAVAGGLALHPRWRALPMKTLLLKLEPVIWLLFGLGIMVGTMLMTGWVLVVGIAAPLGIVEPLAFEPATDLATSLIGRIVLVALVALPLWKGAHHTRHLFIDSGGADRDAVVAPLLYLTATVGSLMAIVAAFRI